MASNYTILCPEQSDSQLSVTASVIGIITFVSTTLGGLTIFYTIYGSLQTARQDIIVYARAAASYGKELIGDIEAMRSSSETAEAAEAIPEDVIKLINNIKRLSDQLEMQVKRITNQTVWIRRTVAIYRFGQDRGLQHSVKELERLTRNLEARKVNLALRRIDEQTNMLRTLLAAHQIVLKPKQRTQL